MSQDAISFEMLSAYVDGELDAADAAHVAAAAAADPKLATAIARLQALRASVADGIPDFVHLPTPRVRKPWAQWHRAAVAASVAFVLMIGAFAIVDKDPSPRALGLATEFAPAVAVHDRWLESSQPALPPEAASAAPFDRLLAATGLRLVLKDRTVLDGGTETVHSRFVGERGCRLSVFESAASGSADPERMEIGHEGALLLARWTDGRSDFTVVARDMDPVRFATIAGALREIGPLDATPPMEELIASLSVARQPCLS